MKKNYFLLILLLPLSGFSQILLQTAEEDELVNSFSSLRSSIWTSTVNISKSSLEVRGIIAQPNEEFSALPRDFFSFSIKGKPTNGIAPLINNGDFQPSVKLQAGYSRSYIFVDPNDESTN